MSYLVIAGFDGQQTADEVLQRLRRVPGDFELDLRQAAVVRRDAKGTLLAPGMDDVAAGASRIGGAIGSLWALLLATLPANPVAGALVGGTLGLTTGRVVGMAKSLDLEDEFLFRCGLALKPNSSAIAFLVRTDLPTKLLKQLEQFAGTVFETTLSAGDEEALRKALEKERIIRMFRDRRIQASALASDNSP